jgi:hypothetical protein
LLASLSSGNFSSRSTLTSDESEEKRGRERGREEKREEKNQHYSYSSSTHCTRLLVLLLEGDGTENERTNCSSRSGSSSSMSQHGKKSNIPLSDSKGSKGGREEKRREQNS